MMTDETPTKAGNISKLLFAHPAHFLSLGFGSGLLPKAPGTFGTLAAIPLYWLMATYLDDVLYAVVLLVMSVVGIVVCGMTERAIGSHDHGSIVWDEVVGYLVTMFLVPAGWLTALAGFILFRLFDILKPFPVSWLDRNLRGGLGTMMDDVAAGILAWISLQALIWFFPAITSV